jgi:hypothetical protein
MEMLVSSLVGGIVGLLIGIIFEEPLNSIKIRFLRWYQNIRYHPQPTIISAQNFSLGRLNTSWLVIDGDGEMTYTPDTIKSRIINTPVTLPPEVTPLLNQVKQTEREKERKGLSFHWNGPLYALERYAIGRTVPNEQMEVTFTFRPSDYYTFLATVMSLDENLVRASATVTLRQKYLQGEDLSQPIPFLAHGFGVALVLITKDKKLMLSRRSENAGSRAGELDVSVVEGVHPQKDASITYYGPDVYRTAVRGLLEEVGIPVLQEDVVFLGFGVDVEYYQWNIIGMVRTAKTADEIFESRQRGASGKWETKQFEVIESAPLNVFKFLEQEKIWSTGLVAIYWTLVHEFGKKKVDRAAQAIFGV